MSKLIPRNSNIRRKLVGIGLSYVEVLLASVIMAVLLVSAVRIFGNIGRSSRMVADQDSAARLALEMIQEIKQLPYKDPASAIQGDLGPETDEKGSYRSLFDDVDDYHGWSASPPQDRTGEDLIPYSHLTRNVKVYFADAGNFKQPVLSDEGFKAVAITISQADKTLAQQTYVIADVAQITIDKSLPTPKPTSLPPDDGDNDINE